MQASVQALPTAVDVRVGGLDRCVGRSVDHRAQSGEFGAAGPARGEVLVDARTLVVFEGGIGVPGEQAFDFPVFAAFEGEHATVHSACAPSSPSRSFMWRRA
jgi:hypothetical protein